MALTRGKLRVYLGAAPGVGKTYRMLGEGRRRQARGTDVVAAFVEAHDRPLTTEMVQGLETIARRTMTYRGATFTEMDLDAVLARRPKVALVDEMAHTNVPGSRNEKRWQDINELLDAGIDVISTVNIQHLESLNDVVEQITGIPQRETIPDAIVRSAEQIELVDMTAEALRRRMAHGNIYKSDKVDAALGNYFRVGNLTALRELALLWLADKVDDQLDRYRREHDIDDTWEARERVVVALTGGPEGDTLIRRAARIAERARGADLLAVHVVHNEGLTGPDPAQLARQRTLIESMGGTFHQVVGTDIPQALLSFARGVNATQLVLGASRRGRFAQLFSRSIGITTVAESGPIDVHLVTHEESRRPLLRWRWQRDEPLGRLLLGLALIAILMPALTIALTRFGEDLSLSSSILIYLVAVVSISLVGRLWAALAAAVVSSLLLNYYFTPPVRTWTIAETQNVLALAVFLLVAVTVSATMNLAVLRTRQAARARREANALAVVAGSVLRGTRPLPALLDQLRESFSLESVTLLERNPESPHTPTQRGDTTMWSTAESVGEPACQTPSEGDVELPVDENLTLVLKGRTLDAVDQRIVEAFAAQAALALRQQRLAEQAAAAIPIAEADRLRTALLRAVSHDLRTPLASAKAAVQSLLLPDVVFDEDDRKELLTTADESLDLLTRLVENLLDMSRLQAGALGLHPEPTSVAEVIPVAVDELGDAADAVTIRLADDLPEVMADPALLQRILANLISNALKYSPADSPPTIAASAHGERVHIRVVDHGPGLPTDERERQRVFLPFQRSGDTNGPPGIGLGLALSRGLAEAMGGALDAEDTPGGGLTMDLTLTTAPRHEAAPERSEETVG